MFELEIDSAIGVRNRKRLDETSKKMVGIYYKI